MEYSLSQVPLVSAKGDIASAEVIGDITNDKIRNAKQDLNEDLSLIPIENEAAHQGSKNLEKETIIVNSETGSESSKPKNVTGRLTQKMTNKIQHHKALIVQKAEIQHLIDFKRTRIELQPFPYATFSKHREKMEIYQLVSLDGEPLTKLVLCTKCRKLLVRYMPSATNLIRHFDRHEKIEEAERIASRKKDFDRLDEDCKPTVLGDCSAGKIGTKEVAKKVKISKEVGHKICPTSESKASSNHITGYSESSIQKSNHKHVTYLSSNGGVGENHREDQGPHQKSTERAESPSSEENQEGTPPANEKKRSAERSFQS